MVRIAILNYADVRNFGDVLFPMVVAREIRMRIPAADLQFVTPTGSSWASLDSGVRPCISTALSAARCPHRLEA